MYTYNTCLDVLWSTLAVIIRDIIWQTNAYRFSLTITVFESDRPYSNCSYFPLKSCLGKVGKLKCYTTAMYPDASHIKVGNLTHY